MVRILSNGDIVQDTDPRVKNRSQQNFGSPNIGRINHSSSNDSGGYSTGGGRQDQYAGGQQVNIFTTFNAKLLEMGVPRVPIGSWVLEPIALVGMVIAMVFLGIPGLVFAGLLFVVYSVSMQSGGNPQGAAGSGFRLPSLGRNAGAPRTGR